MPKHSDTYNLAFSRNASEAELQNAGMFGVLSNERNRQRGLTIIELIVSIGIFTVVAVAAVAALTSVIDANRRTRAVTEANNNLNFVLQTMVREIRNGFNYGCDATSPSSTSACTGGSTGFGFIDPSRDEVGYRLNNTDNSIGREVNGNGFLSITPDEIDVTHLNFRVVGSNDNKEQSRVEITIQAETGSGDATSTLNLQTTATQRLLYTPN